MGWLAVFVTDTQVSRGMKTIARGPATARLSPTVTVAPPSSKISTSSALWCLWKLMTAPGFKSSVSATKSSAAPFCLSILIMNSGMVPGPFACVCPLERRNRCSPSSACRINGWGEDALSELAGMGCGARAFSGRTRKTPSVVAVNATKTIPLRRGMSPPVRLDLGASIPSLKVLYKLSFGEERSALIRLEGDSQGFVPEPPGCNLAVGKRSSCNLTQHPTIAAEGTDLGRVLE
jgi:hypothetical protein